MNFGTAMAFLTLVLLPGANAMPDTLGRPTWSSSAILIQSFDCSYAEVKLNLGRASEEMPQSSPGVRLQPITGRAYRAQLKLRLSMLSMLYLLLTETAAAAHSCSTP
jgi:hypothetical protein